LTAPDSTVSRLKALPHEAHVFGGIGLAFVAIGVLYTATDGEPAGVVLLFGSALLSLTYAVYLARHAVEVQESILEQEEGTVPDTQYLPHQSLWPVGIGVGGVLVLAGFAVGLWVFFAGVVLLGRSVVGFVSEGRARR
jgi:hypothetical protein